MLRLTQLFNVTGHPGDLAAVRNDLVGPAVRAPARRRARGQTDALLRVALACERYTISMPSPRSGGIGG